MEHAHHISPYPSPRMSPEEPGNGSDFNMAGFRRKFVESTKEDSVRTLSWVEPQFCASGSQVDCIVEHAIRRPKKRAVPLFCQSLPVQIVSGSCSGLSRRNTRSVL